MQQATLVFVLCFSAPLVYAQPKNTPLSTVKSIKFREDKIYIVARGTRSKGRIVAQKFNRMDKQITHVGIGFYSKNAFRIFNVSDVIPATQNALVVESLDSFSADADVRYVSIWECDNDAEELERAKSLCVEAATRKIVFDPAFRISRDDTLYCSEFCAEVFRKIDSVKYHFQPRTITLGNAFYEGILNAKTLTYFPVDFFQERPSIRKVAEWQK